MSTLDSWIDRDDLADVLAELAPAVGPPRETSDDSDGDDSGAAADPVDHAAESPDAETEPSAPSVEEAADADSEPASSPDQGEPLDNEKTEDGETEADAEQHSEPVAETDDDASSEDPESNEEFPTAEDSTEEEEPAKAEEVETPPDTGVTPDEADEISEPAEDTEEAAPTLGEEGDDESEAEASDIGHGAELFAFAGNPDDTDSQPAEESPEDSTPPNDSPPPEASQPEATEPISAPEAEAEAEASIDFDEPEAYEASPFPTPPAASPDSPISPIRRTAAVQAAAALERARDRAQLGGLLKQPPSFSPGDDFNQDLEFSLEESTTPEEPLHHAESTPVDEDGQAENDLAPPPFAEPLVEPDQETTLPDDDTSPPVLEPESADTGDLSLTAPDFEEATSDASPLSPEATDSEAGPETERVTDGEEPVAFSPPALTLPLRDRLTAYVEHLSRVSGADSVSVTDFQSYPLLPQANSPGTAHSALRLAHWLGLLTAELQKTRDGFTQLRLGGESGGWLCVIAADSAAGGVCASFRLSESMEDATARQLVADLRATLGEAPRLDSQPAPSSIG